METVLSVGCQSSSSALLRKVISATLPNFFLCLQLQFDSFHQIDMKFIDLLGSDSILWVSFIDTSILLAVAKKLIGAVDEVCGGIDDSDTIEMTTDTVCEAASGHCSQPRAGANNTILVTTYFTAEHVDTHSLFYVLV